MQSLPEMVVHIIRRPSQPRNTRSLPARKPSDPHQAMKYLFLIIGLVAGFQDSVILGPQTYSRKTASEWADREQDKHAGSSSIVYGHLRYDPEYDITVSCGGTPLAPRTVGPSDP
jgi:hypothetical protein